MSAPEAIRAGQGPPVLLIHSSVAGARQWRALIAALQDRYQLIAPNLFGYGATPPWTGPAAQTLADQAQLLAPLLPAETPCTLIGHSFGGSVAMKLAELYPTRIRRLILIEPNPFHLLAQAGRDAVLDPIRTLRNACKAAGDSGDWPAAARIFADYWTGPGSWDAMPPDRQAKFAEALEPNFHEWDAVMSEATPLATWAKALPRATTVISAEDTTDAILEIEALLRAACPHWRFETLPRGGHMAALTQPEMMLPLIESALT